LLNDSKQVLEKDRYELRRVIEAEALAFAVASVSNKEIDRINILKASFKAMHLALAKLRQPPGLILVDGNRFIKYKSIPHRCIIKGDEIFTSIAAASILAKTYRDDNMLQLHREFPHYGWDHNKGYATRVHRDAIVMHGECKHHRKSFRLTALQNALFPG
jgi:ribonuclease HII